LLAAVDIDPSPVESRPNILTAHACPDLELDEEGPTVIGPLTDVNNQQQLAMQEFLISKQWIMILTLSLGYLPNLVQSFKANDLYVKYPLLKIIFIS
jgi:hypothetical protein